MPDSPYVKKLTPGAPATYRIEAQSSLDESWSGGIGGKSRTIQIKGERYE